MVRLGDQNLAKRNDGAQPAEFNIIRFTKHEDYVHRTKQNDVALIELDKIVIFNDFIRPACLYQEATFEGTVVAVCKARLCSGRVSS